MPDQSAEWVAASRLVRRTGFGSTGPDVDVAARLGPAAYVSQALSVDQGTDPGAVGTPAPTLTARRVQGKDLSKAERRDANEPLRRERAELVLWWLRRMTAVRDPLPEKLTLVWHNHFATSLAKVRIPALMLQQNQRLRTLGRGDFRELALAVLTDAAMLRWLDGQRNTRSAPNENLSREFMELFALGHGGGYTESDVREGARALTGWTVRADGSTVVIPRRQDTQSKLFLGVVADLDTAGFCDAVLARPQSAAFVANRLWRQLVSPTPPSAAVLAQLVSAYGARRDLRALLARLLAGPELPAARDSVVVSPVEWMVGAVRALRVPLDDERMARVVARDLRLLGQVPFYPPSVGGWPSGQAWLSAAAVEQRMESAAVLAAAGDLSDIEEAGRSERLAAVAYRLGIGGWSDRSSAVLGKVAGAPTTLVAVALNTPEYVVH